MESNHLPRLGTQNSEMLLLWHTHWLLESTTQEWNIYPVNTMNSSTTSSTLDVLHRAQTICALELPHNMESTLIKTPSWSMCATTDTLVTCCGYNIICRSVLSLGWKHHLCSYFEIHAVGDGNKNLLLFSSIVISRIQFGTSAYNTFILLADSFNVKVLNSVQYTNRRVNAIRWIDCEVDIVWQSSTTKHNVCKPARCKGKLSSNAAFQPTLLFRDSHPSFELWCERENLKLFSSLSFSKFDPPFRPGLPDALHYRSLRPFPKRRMWFYQLATERDQWTVCKIADRRDILFFFRNRRMLFYLFTLTLTRQTVITSDFLQLVPSPSTKF